MCGEDDDSFRRIKKRYDRKSSLMLNIEIKNPSIKTFGVTASTFKPKDSHLCSMQITCYLKKTHDRRSYTRLYYSHYTVEDILVDKAIVKRFMGAHYTPSNSYDEEDMLALHKKRMAAIKDTGIDTINIYQYQQTLRDHARNENEDIHFDSDNDNDDDQSDDTDIDECHALYNALTPNQKRQMIAEDLGCDINDPQVDEMMQP